MTTKVYVQKNGEAVIPASVIKAWGFEPGMELEVDIRVPSDGKPTKFFHLTFHPIKRCRIFWMNMSGSIIKVPMNFMSSSKRDSQRILQK